MERSADYAGRLVYSRICSNKSALTAIFSEGCADRGSGRYLAQPPVWDPAPTTMEGSVTRATLKREKGMTMPLSIEPLFEFILVTNSKRMSKGTRIDDRLFARGSTVRGFDRVPTFMHFRFFDHSPFSKSMELGNLGQPRKGIGTQFRKAVRRPTFGREFRYAAAIVLPP